MAEILRTFSDTISDDDGNTYSTYSIRVCGREREEGSWEGWLEFLPAGDSPVLRSQRETTQPNRVDTEYWASGLTLVYAEGALARTLEPIEPVREAPPDRPAYARPAPPRPSERAAKAAAILDPFSVYRKGGQELLRKELGAFEAWHLRNIAVRYGLVDSRREHVEAESREQLVEVITRKVAEAEGEEEAERS